MKHGETRNRRTETTFAAAETWGTADGQSIAVVPSSVTHTVDERFCARCGWIEERGVIGALTWMAKHQDHDLPAVHQGDRNAS